MWGRDTKVLAVCKVFTKLKNYNYLSPRLDGYKKVVGFLKVSIAYFHFKAPKDGGVVGRVVHFY